MVRSSNRSPRQPARPLARARPHAADQPDPIEREFLELWLGISRLRERILGDGTTQPHRRKRKALPNHRKGSGRAA